MAYSRLSRSLAAVLVLALALTGLTLGLPSNAADAQQTVTYTATQVIPVPPESNYQGSGGGDGWAIALIDEQVYNVFHHAGSIQVACHLESDASECWSPAVRTVAGPDGNFRSSDLTGLYMDQSNGKMYTVAVQAVDDTAGVVCIDTRSATDDMFCGFTPLTPAGDAFTNDVSSLVEYDGRLYAFNFFTGSETVGGRNTVVCFEIATESPCAGQPYTIDLGAGDITVNRPTPAVAAIGSQLVVPFEITQDDFLGCFDMATGTDCSGIWPVAAPANYVSNRGAPFPMLSANGEVIGLCLPTGADDCYELTGDTKVAPAGISAAITASIGWSGEAAVIGARVYVPNGVTNAVGCYDFALGAGCAGFPLALTDLRLMYSVNADPGRPGCLWVNSDGGASQIQNFDAFGGGGCGEGPIRVLTSASIVNTPLCEPASFESLKLVTPTPADYTSATVELLDGSGQSIGQPVQAIDAAGELDLTSFGLQVVNGLPQFLITIEGAVVQEVTVEISWTGVPDGSCEGPNTVVEEPQVSTEVCDGKPVTIDLNINGGDGFGTSGDDVIFGTPGDDFIRGFGGNDTICAGDGSDRVYGGDGDDLLLGEDGIDYLYSMSGNDIVYGGNNIDIVFAGAGDDTVYGEDGSDWIWAEAGADVVWGGSGADRVFGGDDNDTLNGMGGQDRMWGGPGDDTMQGNWNSDTLHGGDGNDVIRGAAGLDKIYGDGGDDMLYGGGNTDYLEGGAGVDVADGQSGIDNPLVVDVSGCDAETEISC